ncbi:MAG: arsenosugar biosynthesis radical SAM protein ArsS [Desulfobacterales bacterium]|nr:arsenosugar biosynthesis radical SAM protein ArsS [Desulfobacterales bacterium]
MNLTNNNINHYQEPTLILPIKVPFQNKLDENQVKVSRTSLTTLQINMGKLCNQACTHCHVEAGRDRKEIMTAEVVERILFLLGENPEIKIVDITGGAPEMCPSFKALVKGCRNLGKEIIDRCNLTVLFEKDQETTPQFLVENNVRIIASLPCYLEENVDTQRGKGAHKKSIQALKMLNRMGYGKAGTGLILNLVYNPLGAFLPPDQKTLEEAYKTRLKEDLDIEFNQLFTITNMPIKRFARLLEINNELSSYMKTLSDNFNKNAAVNVMCKDLISIGWDGQIYDCDFNQMLEIPVNGKKRTIFDIQNFNETFGCIAFSNHCYGCTAGAGSSCTGALAA